MLVRVRCPNPKCGKAYRVEETQLGRRSVCKHCGQEFTLTASGRETLAPAANTDTSDSAPAKPVEYPIDGTPKKLGRFEIRSRLGSGAFGTVYRAHDPVLDREVALKVPRAAVLERPEAKARFLREPKAAAQLRHPHIVPVYDAGSADDHYYIASAYIEGRTLEAVIADDRPDFRRAAQIVRDLAGALDYAHRVGVVHRDVKPANIMIDRQGQALLMDFGLARLESAEEKLTQDGALMGTPAYMSPEQADTSSGEVGPASDQYSLGVVLYELLCGETPFSGPPIVLLFNIANQEPDRPRKKDPTVPRDLETICLKAISKRSRDRYGDCEAMAEDLRRFSADEPIRARRIGIVERTGRWARRNPGLAIMTAAVAMLLVAITAVVAAANLRISDALDTATTALASEEAARRQADLDRQSAEQAAKHEAALRGEAEEARREADSQRERAERALYYTQIAQARQEYSSGNFSRADEILDACPRQLRHWEWGHLKRLCHAEVLTLPTGSYGAGEGSLAFSPDGQRLAAALSVVESGRDDSGAVKVWDAGTGEEVLAIDPGVRQLAGVTFSPDGRKIAAVCKTFRGAIVTAWDATTGQQGLAAGLQKGEPNVLFGSYVTFSPDGRRLAGAIGRTLKVWDAADGQDVFSMSPETGGVGDITFSPDSQRIAAVFRSGDGKAWNTATGEEALPIELGMAGLGPVTFSPDGTRIAAATRGQEGSEGRPVKVWDATTGQEVASVEPTGLVLDIALSSDGRRMALGTDSRTASVWDLTAGKRVLILRGHIGDVRGVAISPDGQRVATAASEMLNIERLGVRSEVRIWDATASRDVVTLAARDGPVTSVAVSPDGEHIAAISGRPGEGTFRAEVLDATTRQQLWETPLPEPSRPEAVFVIPGRILAFCPDGRRIATMAQGIVEVRDAASGQLHLSLPVELVRARDGVEEYQTSDLAFSPDGTQIATAGNWYAGHSDPHSGEVKLRDATSGKELSAFRSEARSNRFEALAFSPDGRRIATGGDVDASGKRSGVVIVWDATRGEKLLTLPGHTQPVADIAFSPDGRRIASTSRDSTVRVWDAATGKEQFTLAGHSETWVSRVVFSPDGQRIVLAADGHSLKFWDATTGQELPIFGEDVTDVAFNPNGLSIVAGTMGGIKIWEAAPWWETDGEPDDGHSRSASPEGESRSNGRLPTASAREAIGQSEAGSGMDTTHDPPQALPEGPPDPDASARAEDRENQPDDSISLRLIEEVQLEEADSPKSVPVSCRGVATSPNGSMLASVDGRLLCVWETATGRLLWSLASPRADRRGWTVVAFNADGSILALGEEHLLGGEWWKTAHPAVRLLSAETGEPIRELEGHRGARHISALAFSPDGSVLASAPMPGPVSDGAVRLWDVATGEVRQDLPPHPGFMLASIAFSPDGSQLAYGYWNGDSVVIWDLAESRLLEKFEDRRSLVSSVAFSPDGSLLGSLGSSGLNLWDVGSGWLRHRMKEHNPGCFSFGPDGSLIASSSETVRLWDTSSGRCLGTLQAQPAYVTFRPDGSLLTAYRRTVRLWEVTADVAAPVRQ